MQGKIVEFRKPLAGQSKQDSERVESLQSNQILDTVKTPKDICGFWLDCTLWVFSSALIGQCLVILSKIFGSVQVIQYSALFSIVLIGFCAYLVWEYESFFKPLIFRSVLILLGILLGVV